MLKDKDCEIDKLLKEFKNKAEKQGFILKVIIYLNILEKKNIMMQL